AVLRRGAVLVDPRPGIDQPRALFAVRSEITDERLERDGSLHIASSELQIVEIDADGRISGGGIAPHLDYRPLRQDQREAAERLLDTPWVQRADAEAAIAYAVDQLVPLHVERVRREREERIDRTKSAVTERLTAEMLYFEQREATLRRQEQEGRKTRL